MNTLASLGFSVELQNKASAGLRLLGKEFDHFDSALQRLEKRAKDVKLMFGAVEEQFTGTQKPMTMLQKANLKFQLGLQALMGPRGLGGFDQILGTHTAQAVKSALKITALAGAIVGLVKVGIDLQNQMRRVTRAMSMTAAEAVRTEQLLFDVAIRYGDSVEEVTDAVVYAARAKIRGEALDEFVDATRLMANVTGMATDEVGQFLYHLTKMHGFTGQVAGMTSQWAFLARELAVSNEQLSAFADEGLRRLTAALPGVADKVLPELMAIGAATADALGDPQQMRDALFELTQPMSEQGQKLRAQLLKSLQVGPAELDTMIRRGDMVSVFRGLAKAAGEITEDEFAKNQQMWSDMFGLSPEMLVALRGVWKDWDRVNATMEESIRVAKDRAYADDLYAKKLNNISEAWRKLKARAHAATRVLALPVFNIFSKVLDGLVWASEKFAGWWEKLPGPLKEGASQVLGLAAAVTALGLALKIAVPLTSTFAAILGGGFLKGVLSLGGAFKWLSKIVLVSGRAMLTTPWGIVITAVGLLAFGIYKLYKNWDQFAAWFKSTQFGQWFLDLKDKFLSVVAALWDGLKVIWDMIANPLSEGAGHWKAFGEFIVDMFKGVGKAITNTLADMLNWSIDKLNWLLDWIPGLDADAIPNVPRLQRGGFIEQAPSRGTPVVAHQGEVIAPLDQLPMADQAKAVVDAIHWLGAYLVQNLSPAPAAVVAPGPRPARPLSPVADSVLRFET
jgi:hypothetical protein